MPQPEYPKRWERMSTTALWRRRGQEVLSRCWTPKNQPQLLVYDVRQGLWHREDDLRAVGFAVSGGVLYAMTRRGIFSP